MATRSPLSPRHDAARTYRLGLRRTTRAHLALASRPAFRAEALKAMQGICAGVGQQLGCALTATAKVLDAEVRVARSLSPHAAFVVLELPATDARAVLEVERAFLTALLERLSGGSGKSAPASRLTRIEEVAFGYLALVGLGAARAAEAIERRFGPRLLAVLDTREEALAWLDARQPHVATELQLSIGSVSGRARLLVPALTLQAAVQDIPAHVDSEIAHQVLGAGLWATVRMGQSRLELFDLMDLAAGDVVLFAGARLEAGQLGGGCRLVAPGFELFGTLSPQGFTLTRAAPRTLPQESPMAAVKPTDQTVASLPVDVEIELTRLKLTLAELAAIKPGAVLPLRINAAEPVLLRVGDRAVARAELVEIENEVGARILNLLPEN
jgi:type III secretion protein Q